MGGLLAYVASLKVDKRARNEDIDDGRYSAVDGSGVAVDGVVFENLKGKVFRVRVAARLRMAVRWGVLLERVPRLLSLAFLWWVGNARNLVQTETTKDGWMTDNLELDLIPYLASVEYRERAVCVLFGGGGRSAESEEPTASSKI